MQINHINIKNYKGIKNLALNINGKSTVFFGENGTGKSSVLSAITAMYYPIINRVAQKKNKPITIEEDDITFGEAETSISMDFKINNEDKSFGIIKNRKSGKKNNNEKSLDEIAENLKATIEDLNLGTPIFVNYGIYRTVFSVPLRIKNQHDSFNKVVAFENCLSSVTDFKTFFEWYRNQEDIENEQIRENKNYIDIPLSCVQNAIYKFLPEISNLKIRRKPRLQMVVTKNDESLQITQLSDGEKCLLALVGDIARRLAIANPKSDNPLEAKGIVLIDEVELHLHPKWQRWMIPNLQKAFINVQFIISTHSPQVLGELKDINVFKFNRINGVVKCEAITSIFGRDSNFILEQYMDTEKEDPHISDEISKLFDFIDEAKYDEAKNMYMELCNVLTPNHADLVKAEILIRRGKRN